MRRVFSVTMSLAALGLGLVIVFFVAQNRARSAELDRWQRWCEIFSRQNETQRAYVYAQERELLQGMPAPDESLRGPGPRAPDPRLGLE